MWVLTIMEEPISLSLSLQQETKSMHTILRHYGDICWGSRGEKLRLPRKTLLWWRESPEEGFWLFVLGLHPWHVEVPRLGANQSCSLQPHQLPDLSCPQIWASSHSNSRQPTAHGNSIALTHWARPGTEPESSWLPVGFITDEPQRELPQIFNNRKFSQCSGNYKCENKVN